MLHGLSVALNALRPSHNCIRVDVAQPLAYRQDVALVVKFMCKVCGWNLYYGLAPKFMGDERVIPLP